MERKLTIRQKQRLIETYKINFKIATNCELTCYWTESKNYELEELYNMIMTYKGRDIKAKGRHPKTVDMRTIFCILGREMQYTVEEIGDFLGQHYSNVLHLTNERKRTEEFEAELHKFREYMNNPTQ